MYQNNQTDARLKEERTTSQTVIARWGTGGGNTPLVRHTTIPIQDVRPIDKAQNGMGIGQESDPSYTLDKMATQGVAQAFNHQSGGDMRGIDPRPTAQLQAHQETSVLVNMVVRRLTPVECERLQGFPDGWTDIRPNTPDGPRYKAIGNSMAVPVMRWIGQRIQAVCK